MHYSTNDFRFQQRDKSYVTCESVAEKKTQNHPSGSENKITWRDLAPIDRGLTEAQTG